MYKWFHLTLTHSRSHSHTHLLSGPLPTHEAVHPLYNLSSQIIAKLYIVKRNFIIDENSARFIQCIKALLRHPGDVLSQCTDG